MAYLTPKGLGCSNPIPSKPVSEILKIRLRGTSAAETRGIAEAFPDLPLHFRSSDGGVYISRDDLVVLRSGGLGCEIERAIDVERIPVRFLTSQATALWPPPPSSARVAVLSRLLAEGYPLDRVAVRYHGRDRSIPRNAFSLDRSGGSRTYVWEIVEPVVIERSLVTTEPDRYPALRGLLSDPDTRVVLALGSGGLKLFAHGPALRLLESLGCSDRIDEVWGASAGAVAGLLFCHGLSPQALEQTGYDIYGGRLVLALRPSRVQFLRHILRDTLLPSSTRAGISGFIDCRIGLSRLIEYYCGTPRPRRPFYCTAFNLAEGRPEVLTSERVPPHLSNLAVQVDACNAAMASASVPLLFTPHEIAGTPYVDGSTTGDVPLFQIVRKWDLDRSSGAERRRRLVIFYVRLGGGTNRFRSPGGGASEKFACYKSWQPLESIRCIDATSSSLRSGPTSNSSDSIFPMRRLTFSSPRAFLNLSAPQRRAFRHSSVRSKPQSDSEAMPADRLPMHLP